MKQKTKVFCTSQNVIFKYKFTKLCPLITKTMYLQQNFIRKNPLLSILPIIFQKCMNLKQTILFTNTAVVGFDEWRKTKRFPHQWCNSSIKLYSILWNISGWSKYAACPAFFRHTSWLFGIILKLLGASLAIGVESFSPYTISVGTCKSNSKIK